MGKRGIVVATDRGGHLHNALMLIGQMQVQPAAIVTTYGPDIEALRQSGTAVFAVAHLFSWLGKLRLPNPINLFRHLVYSGGFGLPPATASGNFGGRQQCGDFLLLGAAVRRRNLSC